MAVDVEKIKQSVEFLKQGEIPYEFRTTVVKELHTGEDILEIGRYLRGASKYFLQSYEESEQNLCKDFTAMPREELFLLEQELKTEIEYVKVRGVE